jgi:hypothetical protein
MRTRTVAIVVALGAIAALALPGVAGAKPDTYKVPGSTYESLKLRGTNGYEMSLAVFDRRLELSVDKSIGHGGLASMSYALHRRLPAGPDLYFRLGQETDVDLRFVPDRTTEHAYPECTGGPEVTERGHFVGAIRYRGREGFTRLGAHRVAGVVTRTAPRTCHVEKGRESVHSFGITTTSRGSRPSVPKGALELVAGTSDRGLNFLASRYSDPRTQTPLFESFDAWIENKEPGFTMRSLALSAASKEDFVSPRPGKPLSAASVSSAAPFSGSATFAVTGSGHGEWTGDLAVELPGYGLVPLTGSKIRAGLCDPKACSPTLPKSLRPRTGSEKGNFKVSYFNEGGAAR